jgi:hypothetical protein
MTTLYLFLVKSGYPEERVYRQQEAWEDRASTRSGASSERSVYLDPRTWPHVPPKAFQLALALNLPAALAALPVGLAGNLLPPRYRHPWMGVALTGLLVPPLWYCVGGWLDRRIGLAPALTRKRSSDLSGAGFVFLVLVAAFAVFGLINGRVHQGGVVFFVGLLVWSVFGALVLWLGGKKQSTRQA